MLRRASRALLGLYLFGMPVSLQGQVPPDPCTAPNARVGIDHVVIAVNDLEEAAGTYRRLGFILKEGRLHANGLENRHVEFGDGTELELMSVSGTPRDDMASGYASFLRDGEGGAYLALEGVQEAVLSAAAEVGIAAEPLNAGAFRYVTFSDPGLASLFFVEYDGPASDPDSTSLHENGAEGVGLVWLEASPELGELLSALGAVACGRSPLPDGQLGSKHGVAGGAVVLAPPSRPRPRVIGVELRSAGSWSDGVALQPPRDTHGVWLGFRSAAK